MKEPYLEFDGKRWPYSQAPVWALKASIDLLPVAEEPDDILDNDFMNRYAAILIRERGM